MMLLIGSIIGGLVGLIILVAIICMLYRVVVPTNMVHIVQSSNKSTPYGKGQEAGNTYYAWPAWIPKYGISVIKFPESIFKVDLARYEAYDTERVPFLVDISAFFRIEHSKIAAQRVASYKELTEQLEIVLQGSVRRILATNGLEDIMEARGTFGKQFTDEVKTQLEEWGVIPVKTIEFMDIRDAPNSSVIENIMAKEQSRIEMDSRTTVANNMQLAESKEIDAQRIVDVRKEDAAQQVGERAAQKDKAVGIAEEQAQQEIKAQARITAEKSVAVAKVEEVGAADIEKATQIVKAEQLKAVTILDAEAQQESTIKIAQGELEQAKLDAEGIEKVGVANGEAERALLQAPVDTQIELAREIGSNVGYQNYLNIQAQIRISGEVGIALAKAMESADLKVIANSNDPQAGVASLGDLFTAKGGTNLSGMMEALSQTEGGQALVDKITSVIPKEPTKVDAEVSLSKPEKTVQAKKAAPKATPKANDDSKK